MKLGGDRYNYWEGKAFFADVWLSWWIVDDVVVV